MKYLYVLAAALVASPALAECGPSDFTVEGFKATVYDDCRRTPCPALKLTGEVRNNCAVPAGVMIKITARDKDGQVVDTAEGWPASTRSIAPNDTYAFDFGPLMRYNPKMKDFRVQIIDVSVKRR